MVGVDATKGGTTGEAYVVFGLRALRVFRGLSRGSGAFYTTNARVTVLVVYQQSGGARWTGRYTLTFGEGTKCKLQRLIS